MRLQKRIYVGIKKILGDSVGTVHLDFRYNGTSMESISVWVFNKKTVILSNADVHEVKTMSTKDIVETLLRRIKADAKSR